MNKTDYPKTGGFTLIELLLSLAVIGILSSVLVVAVGRAKAAANSAKCSAHMRYWQAMVPMFAADHNGKLPRTTFNDPINDGQNKETVINLLPYCDMPDTMSEHERWAWAMENQCTEEGWHFGANSYISRAPMATITDPARQIFFIDMYSGRWLTGTVLNGGQGGFLLYRSPKPHNGMVTVGFLDGHVEPRMLSSITYGMILTPDSKGYDSKKDKPIISVEEDLQYQ
ncbi:type II secretion system protein [Coraliomargarita parva]|uniref:type II secretion system protein n=1 Tax=Coraliomargarita parva TaxID=3014050 RepID=UPI0022B3E189|nr:prepilin-type N-terminal cleavage/methylation domain-containing protein [Coraliomargarita parva]